MSRRKSTITLRATRDESVLGDTLELEKINQEITLVLQEIDSNLSKSNAIINNKIFPILRDYAEALGQVWKNVNFWKYFLEEAAGVEIEDIPDDQKPHQILSLDNEEEEETKKPTENTTTWTAEQQRVLKSNQTYMNASTPERISRPPALQPLEQLQPSENGPAGTLMSLDNHRILVSPKKRSGGDRSLVIQDLINSSPTLPKPPVLLSDIGRSSLGRSKDPESLDKPYDRLSPIHLTPARADGVQRFPRTPNHSDPRLDTPALSPNVFDDDESDLQPPELAHTPSAAPLLDFNVNNSAELQPPILQTQQQPNTQPEGLPKKKRKLSVGDDEENVFLDTTPTTHSIEESSNNSLGPLSERWRNLARR